MYYGLITIAVLLFGGGFAMQDYYQKLRGNQLRISIESSLIGSLAGLVVLVAINGVEIGFTPFTVSIALLAAVNSMAFTFFSFRALAIINLSLYSLFSMLGGMVLPFLQGILFYGEELTPAKIACLGLILAALLMTVSKSDRKGSSLYYVGVFLLNGMSGVLAKLFSSASFEKTEAAGYSIWISICTAALSGLLLLFLSRGEGYIPLTWKAVGVNLTSGSINQVANYFLVIALAHVDASVQYPMVTGGVMIVSTAICFFGEKKPGTKELISVFLAFCGMLMLFIFH